ncbi:MAG: ribosomal RNA small subunit methyltransferase A [Alphaproteobacteria bacterium]|nr:MAG: ribosomal RNA small subunit methyltransferase A [Alphaproteobacteria bacterium]
MTTFNFSWVRQFEAKKSLGQNFLIDPNQQSKIVESLHYNSDDVIVEIGPGVGSLTHLLVKKNVIKVILIEKDPRFCEHLQNVFGGIKYPKVEIIQADALEINWKTLESKPYRLISNLPYNISTPLIMSLIKSQHIEEMILMVQKEVAQRIVAKHGSKTYGRLSIMLQWLYDCDRLFDVGPSCFRPQPKVTSSVVRLKKRNIEIVQSDLQNVEKFTQLIFHQRRKMMKSILNGKVSMPEIFLKKHGVLPTSRPESLSVQTIVEMGKDFASA